MTVFMSRIAANVKVDRERMVASLREAAESFESGQDRATLDFSAVGRIDSAGLRALQDLAHAAEDKAVKVTLQDVSVDVYRVLKLVKLTQKFVFEY